MSHSQKKPQPRCRVPAYRPAFERLDEALARGPEISPAEKIRRIFGRVVEFSPPQPVPDPLQKQD